MNQPTESHTQGTNLRTLVFGGREFRNRSMLYRVLDDIHQKRGIAAVIHGAARGADSLAGDWAHSRGIPVEAYPVTPEEWRAIGRSAGIRRNEKMLKEGRLELAVGFPGNTGTKHMARIAAQSGLPTLRVTTTGHVAVPPGANRLPPKEAPQEEETGNASPVAAA